MKLVPRFLTRLRLGQGHALRFGYEQGFRFPDAGDYRWWSYFNDQLGALHQLGAGKLKPETSHHFDVAYRGDDLLLPGLSVDAGVNYGIHADVLAWQDWSTLYPSAFSDAKQEGSHDEAWWSSIGNERETYHALNTNLGITYQRGGTRAFIWHSFSQPVGNGQQQLPSLALTADRKHWRRFPRQMAKLSIQHRFDRFTVAAGLRLRTGVHERGDGKVEKLAVSRLYQDGMQSERIINVSVSYQVNDRVGVQLFAKNVGLSQRRIIVHGTGGSRPPFAFAGAVVRYTSSLQ